MRGARGLLGVLVLVAGVAVARPAVAAQTVEEYVALGDSYSSGLGTGDYDRPGGSCHRGPRAYPALWAARHPDVEFRFLACSGATTVTVATRRMLEALGPETGLVTLTVGGNDAGFVDVMTTCVLSGDRDCARRAGRAVEFVRTELPGRLDRTYAAIAARASSAEVVVFGYPRLFEIGACPGGLSRAKRAALNEAADALAATTEQRAGAAGFTFVDMRDRFAGHGVCAADPWINPLTSPLIESYHPNRLGHARAYLPALLAAAR
ncbi:GDSL-like lipase/acylhydrolase family protein [Amycolatopsis cihanbeyliensis]|uniref:GDSL-like lipase/acylhydrolase family protein n=1 Tax=Amycolatopsis cihanbeyliensis TaxID=1128664 RepID=A0A542DRN7_AMYCI|nr:GDSL-like lipase/acylhydrolase family protein [Amycolatopsis cihanbeyliensis]